MSFHGKQKAVTFTYDDGVRQDLRLIELFDRYGVKGTFNLNSGLFGKEQYQFGGTVRQFRFREDEIKEVYRDHEVAVHTVSHRRLTELSDEEALHEIEDDRKALERAWGHEIVGMAYPEGGINFDERIKNLIREKTPIRYARTTISNGEFGRQEDLLEFHTTAFHLEFERMLERADAFIAAEPEEGQELIFSVWGHSYEFDFNRRWDDFERMLERLASQNDVFFGTNREVLLNRETNKEER